MTLDSTETTRAAAELARAREAAYGFLAGELAAAPGGDDGSTAGQAERLRLAVGPLHPERVEEMASWLLDSEGAELALRRAYSTLLEIRGDQHLLPFESVYTTARWDGESWQLGRLRGPVWHEVLAFYRRHGLEVDPDAGVEADHIACELSFLGGLCGREAEAWSRDDAAAAESLRGTQLEFLEAHPGAWITRLRQRADDLTDNPWYRGVVHLIERLLLDDQRHLGRDGPER